MKKTLEKSIFMQDFVKIIFLLLSNNTMSKNILSTEILWYWRRLLRLPWTASRSNQSILKEINPEHSLEGLILKLKLQYSGHLIDKATHWKRP